MPNPFRTVQPGEIISAARFNEILAELTVLRDRVTALESQPGGGLVQVTGFVPASDVGQQVGGQITIQGAGFEVPAWNAARLFLTNEITINNQPVSPASFVLPQCTSTQLVVIIPSSVDDGSLGPNGRDVPIRVVNRFGSANRTYRVFPSIATRPNPIINAQTANPPGLVGEPSGGNVLEPGQPVVVNGANFSPTPAENTVTIEFEGNSFIVTNVGVDTAGSRLNFILPTNMDLPTGTTPGQVRVTVTGAAASAVANCTLLQR